MDQLLQSVADHSVPLEDLSLAQVTEQIRDYVQPGQSMDLKQTGDVVRDAAVLLLMKSAHLLPCLQVDEPEEDATERLRLPLSDRQGIQLMAGELAAIEGSPSFAGFSKAAGVDRRLEPRPAKVMTRIWEELRDRRQVVITQIVAPAFVRLEVAVSGLLRSLKRGGTVSLRGVLHGSTRQDAVIHFLAILEVVRQRQARVTQIGNFEDIVLTWREEKADADARAG